MESAKDIVIATIPDCHIQQAPRFKVWTQQEKDKLKELSLYLPYTEIAKKLGRSPLAIQVKMKKLQISRRSRAGWFTEEEVCSILGVDHKWLRIRKFPMKPHDSLHPPRKGKSSPWHISERALKSFIRRYPEELVGHKVDIIMLVDILAGITYDDANND